MASGGDKIDMSLDEIIQQNRKKNTRGRGRGAGGARRGGNRGGRQQDSGRRRSGGGVRSGVQKRTRGGIRSPVFSGSKGKNIPDVWQHDMFDGGSTPVRRRNQNAGGGYGSGANSGVLRVSNLDFGVNDSDINELFAEFGELLKAAVHYDRTGRSLGSAEIKFTRYTDAVKAMKQYNNVPLDGRPMSIELLGSGGQASETYTAPRRQNNRTGGGNYGGNRQSNSGRGRGSGGRGGRGRGGRGRDQKKTLTVDELNAQLDAYKMDID